MKYKNCDAMVWCAMNVTDTWLGRLPDLYLEQFWIIWYKCRLFIQMEWTVGFRVSIGGEGPLIMEKLFVYLLFTIPLVFWSKIRLFLGGVYTALRICVHMSRDKAKVEGRFIGGCLGKVLWIFSKQGASQPFIIFAILSTIHFVTNCTL